jgi:broad specificity phosphatase PhoE
VEDVGGLELEEGEECCLVQARCVSPQMWCSWAREPLSRMGRNQRQKGGRTLFHKDPTHSTLGLCHRTAQVFLYELSSRAKLQGSAFTEGRTFEWWR